MLKIKILNTGNHSELNYFEKPLIVHGEFDGFTYSVKETEFGFKGDGPNFIFAKNQCEVLNEC